MDNQMWYGAAIAAGSGVVAWVFKQLWNRDKRKDALIEKLQRQQEDETLGAFHRSVKDVKEDLTSFKKDFAIQIRELSDRFTKTDLYSAKLQAKLEGFSDVIAVVGRIRDDVQVLKGQVNLKSGKHTSRFDDDGGHDI